MYMADQGKQTQIIGEVLNDYVAEKDNKQLEASK